MLGNNLSSPKAWIHTVTEPPLSFNSDNMTLNDFREAHEHFVSNELDIIMLNWLYPLHLLT